MACFRGDFYSDALGMQTSAYFVIPENVEKNGDLRVLYLLHGMTDNCSNWMRYSSAERYAVEYRTALIMPEVQRSSYTDMKYGPQYFTYTAKELPAFAQKTFGLSSKREQNMVGGLSMGGYGTLKCALTYPEQYAYCMAFSCGRGRVRYGEKPDIINPNMLQDLGAMFGPELECPPECDLAWLAKKAADAPLKPKMYMACGLQDPLLPDSRSMAALLKEKEFDILYEEWEGGHTWEFWDAALPKALRYFFGGRESGVKTPLSDGT